MRQLDLMAGGAERARWNRTSFVCALIANAHRDPKKHRPFEPSDFNPYAAKTEGPVKVIALKKFFTKGQS